MCTLCQHTQRQFDRNGNDIGPCVRCSPMPKHQNKDVQDQDDALVQAAREMVIEMLAGSENWSSKQDVLNSVYALRELVENNCAVNTAALAGAYERLQSC